MSEVRRQRCQSVRRRPDGWAAPAKYGISGCMPALVNSTVASAGNNEAPSMWACARSVKKSMKVRRIESESSMEATPRGREERCAHRHRAHRRTQDGERTKQAAGAETG